MHVAQRRKCDPIWQGKDKEAQRISNHGPLSKRHDESEGHSKDITDADVDVFRAAIRTFERHTAMSHDMTNPHDLAHTSDEALRTTPELFRRCEDEGRRPGAWRSPCLVCTPKEKESGFRLIARLHVAYRSWAKHATREVFKWTAE